MRQPRHRQASRIGAKQHMSLPLVLDIAIGLIFIYLILSLLASEIQEILATLLQWRAVHLKKSIEVLLTGGEGEAENQVREFADNLYSNPLIKNINQEAKGWVETSLRSITWGIGSIYRQIRGSITGRGKSTFGGSKHSGPSYLNAETFTTTLLETSGIPVLVQKLSELKLEDFIQTNLQAAIAEAQASTHVPPLTSPAATPETATTTALGADASPVAFEDLGEAETNQATAIDPEAEALQAQLQTEFDGLTGLTQQFNQILEDFRANKFTLEASLKWIAYRLDRYIERCQEICAPYAPRGQAFIKKLQSLRQEIFESDPTSGAIAVRPVLQSLVRPSLVEIVEAVTDQDSPTYRRLSSIIGQKINGLLPEKLAHELVQEIRIVLEKFNVITQGTALYTDLEVLQQSLSAIATHDKSTTENRIDLVHQMLAVRDSYINNAESYLTDVDFLADLNALKNISLTTFKHKLISELDAVLDSFRDITRGTQLHIRLDTLRQVLDEVISSFERGEIQLLSAINQMMGARDAYIDNAGQYIAKAQIPVKRRDKFLRQINTPKQKKDFLRSVDEQQRIIFRSFDNHVAMIAWLGATPEELDWEIKHNSEIYQQISSLIKDKNIAAYTDVVTAIARLPKPIKDSLSVLARRAQEKSTTVENEVKQLQFEIETWFDRSMERATGVYKRNAKGVAIILGSLIAITANADTFHIVNRLSKNTVLRTAIAENATQVVDRSPNGFSEAKAQLERDLETLPLPIGWDVTNRNQQFLRNSQGQVPPLAYFKSFLGWLISGIAISMGASFWFDLLSKVVNVRNSGKPPAKTQEQK
jgi:phosphoribosylformylglycinamidine (FGAM) synthase PurS component